MKKILFVLIAVIISLVGCNDQKTSEKITEQEVVSEEVSTNEAIQNEKKVPTDKKVVYEELTGELNDDEAMFVLNVTDNGNSYTLQGIIFDRYIIPQLELDTALEMGEMVLDGKIFKIVEHPEEIDFFGTIVYDLFEEGNDKFSEYYIVRNNNGYELKRNVQDDVCLKSTGRFVSITIDKNTQFEENEGILELPVTTVTEEFENYTPSELRDNDTSPRPRYYFKFTEGKCSFVKAYNGI